MRILIAPNAFKNSLNATEAAASIRTGLLASGLDCTCTCFPIGDGGDGTMQLIVRHFNGKLITARVQGPLGEPVNAAYGLIDNGTTAVIGISEASGLQLAGPNIREPLRATTFGTGQLISHALGQGARKLLITLGGSATIDGGTGMLSALGVMFTGHPGTGITRLPEDLHHLTSIDVAGIDSRLAGATITVLCDVENPLLGKYGAAQVYGPQKGASPADVDLLEIGLTRFADQIWVQTGKQVGAMKYGGAAGGSAAGLFAFTGAKLVNGSRQYLKLTAFDEALGHCDLLITGEGSIDEQTVYGKGPFEIATRARRKNIPVIGFAGCISEDPGKKLQAVFNELISVNDPATGLQEALRSTGKNLEQAAKDLGNRLMANRRTGG